MKVNHYDFLPFDSIFNIAVSCILSKSTGGNNVFWNKNFVKYFRNLKLTKFLIHLISFP